MNRNELSKIAVAKITEYNEKRRIDGRSYNKLLSSAKNGRTDTLNKIINNIDAVGTKGKISYASLLRSDREVRQHVERTTHLAAKNKEIREYVKKAKTRAAELKMVNEHINKLYEVFDRQHQTMKKVESLRQAERAISVKADYFVINTENADITTKANALKHSLIGKHDSTRFGVKVNNIWFNNIKSIKDIKQALRNVFRAQKNRFKMVVKFGLLLYKPPEVSDSFMASTLSLLAPKKLGDVKLYRPNEGRRETDLQVTDKPYVVKNWKDLERFIGLYINLEFMLGRLKKPDSKTKLLGISNMLVEVYPLGQVMGRAVDLPEHILKSKFVSSLKDIPHNLCVFASLAMAKGIGHRCVKEAKKIYEKLTNQKFQNTYTGYDITYLEPLASQEKMNIRIYSWEKVDDKDVFALLHESVPREGFKDVYLLADKNHVCYINNAESLMKTFQCDKCEKLIDGCWALTRHKATCNPDVEQCLATDRVVAPYENKIKKMSMKYGLKCADYYLPYFICFDYEALLVPIKDERDGKLQFTTEHRPVSCSLASNIPDVGVKFFCLLDYNGNYNTMNKAIVQYAISLAEKATAIYREKFADLIARVPVTYKNKDGKEVETQDHRELMGFLESIPIVGFNNQKYDLNMNKAFGFFTALINDADGEPMVIKRGGSYMLIKTKHLKVVDVTNYLAPCSYDSYLKSYKCAQTKGFFPYEYFKKLTQLNETKLPPHEAFYSSLKRKNISTEEYEYMRKVWKDNDMKSCRDLLEWYNNLDVVPFVEAVEKQQAFTKEAHGFDFFHDALSISSYAEKSMIKYGWKAFTEKPWKWERPYPDDVPPLVVSPKVLKKKIDGYMTQDREAKRDCTSNYVTPEIITALLENDRYCCHWCKKPVDEKFTLDRKDNNLAHLIHNCVIACVACNTSRGGRPYLKYKFERNREYFAEESPQIVVTSNKDIYKKIRDSMVGGPSIVFHRYHARNKTFINRPVYDLEKRAWVMPKKKGKLVKRIVGFDANALYLWCVGQYMPCGQLEMLEEVETADTVAKVLKDDIFGFVEVDIHVPEHLYNYFSEMPPIFKNVELDGANVEHIGEYMARVQKEIYAMKGLKGGKLIGSMKGEKITLLTPLLKWYLEKGLIVTKVYSVIKAIPNKVFFPFMQYVSDARRAGDVDSAYQLKADGAKLEGNSAIGHTIMDKGKHTNTRVMNNIAKVEKCINTPRFRGLDEVYDGEKVFFEVESTKDKIKLDNPLQIGVAVYGYAKLRMLQFYFDVMDKYWNREDFQYVEMDTDSAYMAITYDSFEQMPLKKGMEEEFEKDKYNWFTDDRTPASKAYTKRTPGLFKVEYEGDSIVALNSKVYHVSQETGGYKMSAKGSQKGRNLDRLGGDDYLKTLQQEKSEKPELHEVVNQGFRVIGNKIQTYTQTKRGLSSIYYKRIVMEDGVTTYPSPL